MNSGENNTKKVNSGGDNAVSKWISTQDDELVLTVEMTAIDSQFNDYSSSYNPAFNVNRLTADQQPEARSSIEASRTAVLDAPQSVRGTEVAVSNANTSSVSSPRKPMKDVLSFGSVRFNALSSPHSFRQSEMRSPGRMTLSHPNKSMQ